MPPAFGDLFSYLAIIIKKIEKRENEMYLPFEIHLTLQDLIALNPANLILVPLLSMAVLVVNIPVVGPLFAKGCALVFGH